MDQLSRLTTFKTELPPCCLRLYKDVLFLGTYKLVEGRNRHGSIEVWRRDGDNFSKVKTYPTKGAILDLKLDPFHPDMLCSCHSLGNIILWKIDPEDASVITQVADRQLFPQTDDQECLITAINYHQTIPDKLVVTTTTGVCAIYDLKSETLTEFSTTHDLECWYAEFGNQPGLENLVISGGDDRQMILHDLRDPDVTVCKNSTFHEAGVVAVLTSSEKFCSSSPFTIWTGSYDDHVRSIDLRYMEASAVAYPRVTQKLNLGGGVWKLIPSPDGDNRVLSCCMYDGARLLRYNEKTGQDISVDKYFKGDHSSMCYGGDWKEDVVVTCSFYDNVVQVWDPSSFNIHAPS